MFDKHSDGYEVRITQVVYKTTNVAIVTSVDTIHLTLLGIKNDRLGIKARDLAVYSCHHYQEKKQDNNHECQIDFFLFRGSVLVFMGVCHNALSGYQLSTNDINNQDEINGHESQIDFLFERLDEILFYLRLPFCFLWNMQSVINK